MSHFLIFPAPDDAVDRESHDGPADIDAVHDYALDYVVSPSLASAVKVSLCYALFGHSLWHCEI